MKTKIWTNGPIYIINIEGDIKLADSDRLKKLIMKMVEKKVEKLIINTGKIDSIDSSGIGALIFASSNLKKLGLSLAIANVSGALEQVMDKTKLSNYLPIYKDVGEAIQKFSQD